MAAVLYLTDVLQKIIDRLYHRSFPEQYFVSHVHQNVFHILAQPRNYLDALLIQMFKKRLRNISPVGKEFSFQLTA
jgi:hypothetical protein